MALLRRRTKTDDVPRAGPYAPGWEVPARFNFTRDVVDALATDPARPAVTFVDREGIVDRRTFHDVSQDAARWAHLLRTRVDRGDRVVIAVGKTPAWSGALLGALKSGVVAVPCPDMLRARDLGFRVRHSGAQVVIADRSLEAEIEEMRHQVGATVSVLYLDDALEELRRYMPVAPTEDTTAGERALILYTSGTTKDPKGVVHTHAYTWAQRAQAAHWLDAHEGDVVWCTAGTGWAKAIWNVLLGPWSQGAEVVLHEGPFDPEERLSLLQRLGVTVLCQAPTEYRMLAKLDTLGAVHLPAAAPCGLGRRAAQPGGDRTIPGCARADRPRRLRADRELAPGRERARYADPSGLDGTAHAGARRRSDRRDGSRLPARRRGRSRADRTATHTVRRLLGRARGDRSGVQGRLVPHGRSGDPRRQTATSGSSAGRTT